MERDGNDLQYRSLAGLEPGTLPLRGMSFNHLTTRLRLLVDHSVVPGLFDLSCVFSIFQAADSFHYSLD